MVKAEDKRSLERSVGIVPLVDGAPIHLEPEYLVFSPDSSFLYVTLQENNLVAAIQTELGQVARYYGLGKTEHVADRTEDGGGGLAHEHEHIEVVELPVDEALARLEAGEISDAKSVIALQWLAARRRG